MALEFEKITPEIERMAQGAVHLAQEHSAVLDEALHRLQEYATAWGAIEDAIDQTISEADIKYLRAARPVDHDEPLDARIKAPDPPDLATLIAVDGSQILPDRHAAHLYSLINIGVITYYHGQQRAPLVTTFPELDYPHRPPSGNGRAGVESAEETFVDNGAVVNIRRDLGEIQTLARTAWEHRHASRPLLALLDQRLLYWPTIGTANSEGQKVLDGWQQAMDEMHTLNCYLAGYITRPGKRSVLTMLRALDLQTPGFDIADLYNRTNDPGPTDADLFHRLLAPGERSKVFFDVSENNQRFAENKGHNEVCFFYLNPGRSGRQIARVDIPLWVACVPEAIATVHALIYDQCQIMGDYPYILTRADEEAVVSFNDHENLDIMIANAMQKVDLQYQITAKQSGKQIARSGRTRHEIH